MTTRKVRKIQPSANAVTRTSSPVDEMLIAALERGDETFETGRFLATFKEGAAEAGLRFLGVQGMRVADARDYEGQAATLESVGDADAVVFPEIGVALIGGDAAQERSMATNSEFAADNPIESLDPEHFVFADGGYAQAASGLQGGYMNNFTPTMPDSPNDYMRGFLRATETIVDDMRAGSQTQMEAEEEALVLGVTPGLQQCRVPPSVRSGAGIKVAALGTGMDLGHPDFVGRPIVSASFVGQPVQDLNGHNTHLIGTACGPRAPAGSIPRYGIGYRTSIFVGKVVTNSGSSVGGSLLAGMNWAIANRCPVIFTAVGSQAPVGAAFTAAGQAALNNGCLIIASSGSNGSSTGAPANSPTIMAVASLNQNLSPSSFSNSGKIDIAAPGVLVFSSWPRPDRYRNMSGCSTATAHVAGCAALLAEVFAGLRGRDLWTKLLTTARRLPYAASRVGAGLVQAP